MAPKQYLDDDGEPVGKGSGITPPAGYSLLVSKKSDKPKKTAKVADLKAQALKMKPVVPPSGYLLTKSPLLDQFYAKEKQRVADAPVSEGADAFNAPAARVAPLYKPTYNPANQAAGAQSTLASVPNAPKPKTIGEEVKAQRVGSHITYVAPNIGQPAAHPDASYVQAQPLISPEVTGTLKEVATHPLEVLTGASLPSQQQENMQRAQRVASETNDPFLKAAPAVEQRQHDPTINISGTKTFQKVLDPKSKNVFSRVMTGGTKGVEALSSVDNLGLMAGMYFSPADAGQLISAVFSAQMAQGAGSQGIETLKAAYRGDYGEAAEKGANALVSAAFAATAGKHALGIEKAPSFAESARQGLTEGAGDVMGGRTITDHPFTPVVVAPSRDRTNVLHRNTAGEVRQAKGQAPTVWLSPTAWKYLMGAMYPKESAESIAATHGINLEANEKLLALANNPELAATNPVFGEVQRLLAEAHKNAGKGGVAIGERRTEYIPDLNRIDPNTGEVVKDPKTGKPFNRVMQANINVMREELNHTWQRSLAANGKWQNHLSEKSFSSLLSALPKGMVSHLVENNYDGSDAPLMVTESAARLMGGDPGYFSVTPEEAASFMHSYFDEVVKQHGPEALNSLKRIRGVAKQVKETVDAEHKARGTNDGMGNGAADRGNLQGVPTGGRRAPESIQATQQSGEGKEGGIDGIHNSSQNVETTGSPISDEGSQALRNVHDNTGMVGETLFNREKNKPIWYLKSERLIGEKMRGPMPAGDVQKMLLAGGVKPDEMKWTGLDDFLDSKGKEKVTPEEVKKYLTANSLQVKEVQYGGPKPTYKKEELSVNQKESDNNSVWVIDAPGQVFQIAKSKFPDPNDAIAYIVKDKTRSDAPYVPETQYGTYQLGGGNNYRELLLTMPGSIPHDQVIPEPTQAQEEQWDSLVNEHHQIVDNSGRMSPGRTEAERQAVEQKMDDLHTEMVRTTIETNPRKYAERPNFTQSHWDEPNVLAHVRFNDRTGPNGEKLLHLEELQSDWAQKGRKRGFADPKTKQELEDKYTASKGKYDELDEKVEGLRNDLLAEELREEGPEKTPEELDRIRAEIRSKMAQRSIALDEARSDKSNLNFYTSTSLPEMPFSKTWHEMVLRRALKYASDKGYDGVSWTGGVEQVNRYPDELRKAVDRITWTPAHGETGEKFVQAFKEGQVIFKGTIDSDGKFRDYNAAGKHVDEVIGKSMGRRILEENGGDIEGKDFTVGGEGMKGFYDKIIPDYLNKFGKKYNAKVGETEIPAGEKSAYKYEGPDRTLENVKTLRKLTSENGPDKFVTPFMEGRSMFAVNRVTPDRAARDVETAMTNGMSFKDAMAHHGSPELAQYLGGEMRDDTIEDRKTVQYLPITPEMRKSVTEEGVPLFNKEKPYKELDRLDPKATMGTPNSAAIITGDGKVKVGDGHYELMEDNGYKDYADLFAAGGVRIRPAYGGMNIEIGKIDNDVLSRVRKTIASFPGMDFTVEFTPANNRAPKSISGGADIVLLGLEKWQRVGEAAAKYASPSYWHERGNDELFNRVYKSPDADQEEIDDVQGQLDATKDIIHRNPLPTNPDLSTPEKRAAWNEDKEDWNRDYGYNEDHIKALERRLGYLKNKSIGEVRQLPDKTKVVYLTRKGLDDLHEAFGSSYSPNFSINGASLDNLSLSKVFKNLDEYKSPHSREIKKLITQGLDDKGSVTIAMVPEKGQSLSEALATLREELGHTWQKRFEEEAGKHLPEIEFKKLNDAIPAAMSDYLKRNDYKDDDGSDKENKFRVLESAAKMVADNPKALGLSEDEWADYLFQYFELVEKTNGKDALDQLKHITTPARHVKEDYYNAKGNGSGSETDRGVLGGVQGGGEGSPKGTSSEKESDGGASSTDRRVNGGLQAEVDPNDANILRNREQTKTPEFKKFFGDSKIVDKDGEPMVLYHGTTRQNPKVLQQSFEAGNGIFLTDNEDVASTFTLPREYGETVFEDEDGNEIEEGDVVPIYARIEKPLVISGKEAQDVSDDTALQARTLEKAKADGHDGVILRDIKEGIGERYRGDTYVVFDPRQVKHTEKNSGAFDPKDPNILRNREKSPDAKEEKDTFLSWNQVEHGKPATLYAYRGEGSNAHPLEERYQRELGRETLLGSGLYFARSKDMAKTWGNPKLYRVSLENPYVISKGNFSDIRRLDIEKINKDGYDGIIIKNGQYGAGRGQENIAQGIIFNPTKDNAIPVSKVPEPNNLTVGATVRIKQPLAKGYLNQYPELKDELNNQHKVVSISPWGHLEIKVGKRRIGFLPEEVEQVGVAGQESSLEVNPVGGVGESQSTVDRGSTGTTPTTENSKTYRDFEQYAAMNGASRQDYGDPALARSNSSVSQSSRDSALKNQSAKDSALTERRDALRQEYREKIASGEVREMTEGERLKEQADSNPESEATKAAQRILEKRAAFKASAVSVQGGTVIVGGPRQETVVPVKHDWVPREDTTNGGYRAPVGTKRIGREGYVDVLTELPISSLVMPQGNNLYAQTIQKYQAEGDSDYPVVIPDERGNVVDDGNHRIEAARRAGKSSTMVWMRQPENSTERTKDLEQWYKDNPSGAVKVHTSLPHQTTAQVSVPLQTAMGVTPVVTKRILPLSELKVLAAGLNPQRKVSNIKDLIAEANRRNPTKMIP